MAFNKTPDLLFSRDPRNPLPDNKPSLLVVDQKINFETKTTSIEDQFKTLEKKEIEITKKQSELLYSSIVQIQRSVKELTLEFESYSVNVEQDIKELRVSIANIFAEQDKLKNWSSSVDVVYVDLNSSMDSHRDNHEKHVEVHARSVEVTKGHLTRLGNSLGQGHKDLNDRLAIALRRLDDDYSSISKDLRLFGSSGNEKAAAFAREAMDKHSELEKKILVVSQLVDDRHREREGLISEAEKRRIGLERQLYDLDRGIVTRHEEHAQLLIGTKKSMQDAHDKHTTIIAAKHSELEVNIGGLHAKHEETHANLHAQIDNTHNSVVIEMEKHVQLVVEKHNAIEARAADIDKQLLVVDDSTTEIIGKHCNIHVEKHTEFEKRIDKYHQMHTEKHEEIVLQVQNVDGSVTTIVEEHEQDFVTKMNGLQVLCDTRHEEYVTLYKGLDSTTDDHHNSLLDMLDDLAHGHHKPHIDRLDLIEALLDDHHNDHMGAFDALDAAHSTHISAIKKEIELVCTSHKGKVDERLKMLDDLHNDRHGQYEGTFRQLRAAHGQHKDDFLAHRNHVTGPEFFQMLLPHLRITTKGMQ